MGLISWLQNKLGGKSVPISGQEIQQALDEYGADISIREIAFFSAVGLIAKSIGKCEFRTYLDGKETRGEDYYTWNFQPNQNENAGEFMDHLLARLFSSNEALVVEWDGNFYVADSYSRQDYALYEDVFSQVAVGDFTFSKSFRQSEVLCFRLSECNTRSLVNALFASYQKLIQHAMTVYGRSNGNKGVFTYEALPTTEQEKAWFDDLFQNKFKTFLSSPDAILPLGKGQNYTDIGSKTYRDASTRDIRAMIDDVFDFTAKAFNIPPALLRGDVAGTSDAVDNLLTFCIDPLASMLEKELNRKLYGKAVLDGSYIKIDTRNVKHIDLLTVASGIDKLISSATFCINDIRRLCGEPEIDEPWAWQHWMTKNYDAVQAALTAANDPPSGDAS